MLTIILKHFFFPLGLKSAYAIPPSVIKKHLSRKACSLPVQLHTSQRTKSIQQLLGSNNGDSLNLNLMSQKSPTDFKASQEN